MSKKLIVFSAMFISCATAMAQESVSEKYNHAMEKYPPRIGIKAGFNNANITINDAGSVNDKRAIQSWHAGVYADIPILPVVSLQAGVLLTGKGAKYTIGDNSGSNYTTVTTRPLYLEIPVNAVVKLPLPNKVKLFAGAGPYMAVGVGGKNDMDGKLLGVGFTDNGNVEYGSDNPDNNGSAYDGHLKRFDFGANLMAGIEVSHLTIGANYGIGMVNIKPGSGNDKGKYQNRVFSLSVGAIF